MAYLLPSAWHREGEMDYHGSINDSPIEKVFYWLYVVRIMTVVKVQEILNMLYKQVKIVSFPPFQHPSSMFTFGWSRRQGMMKVVERLCFSQLESKVISRTEGRAPAQELGICQEGLDV